MGAKGNMEKLKRSLRTLFFMVTMMASLLTLSLPMLVAFGDVTVSLGLASRFACGTCYGLKEHVSRYAFRKSLIDIPLVSIVRSIFITCVYSICHGPGLSQGPYLGTVTICAIVSIAILGVKACLFTPTMYTESEISPYLEKLHVKKSWGMSVLFLSSMVFAFGHIVVAYRTSCRARRKLMFHHADPESVLSCKIAYSGFQKIPRSPTPCSGKNAKSDSEIRRKTFIKDEQDIPVSLLADADSMFVNCQGSTVHYKLSLADSTSCTLASSSFHQPNISRHRLERPLTLQPKSHYHHNRSLSYQFQNSSLCVPLLPDSPTQSTFFTDEIPALKLDESGSNGCSYDSVNSNTDMMEMGKFAVVLVHGFGGGVFSWRHVISALARQIGCTVVAFDRPGWGLTSRPRRSDWEDIIPNPYKLESQVDLLISFCSTMGFSSVVFVGHDDGGLLVLKAAEKLRASTDPDMVEVKGVVLLNTILSREVVPAFARILLHTSLGKKHMVRPLLRTEITQVINRRAWYDSSKLSEDVLNLYKAPLYVEGWDEALHEIGRLSNSTVLSPQNAASLLQSVEDIPVLVVAGAEDALVPLKSIQAMSSKLVNSRLVAISGCGHLPHEECPKALLSALSPFISRLVPSADTLQNR